MSKTTDNLKEAFAGESQAFQKYTSFAEAAANDGKPNIAALFRTTAQAERIHAAGHFKALDGVGSTVDNLKEAIGGETYEYTEMYPGMSKTARDEGFEDVAEWFETLAKAEKSHAGRFQKALDGLEKL